MGEEVVCCLMKIEYINLFLNTLNGTWHVISSMCVISKITFYFEIISDLFIEKLQKYTQYFYKLFSRFPTC